MSNKLRKNNFEDNIEKFITESLDERNKPNSLIKIDNSEFEDSVNNVFSDNKLKKRKKAALIFFAFILVMAIVACIVIIIRFSSNNSSYNAENDIIFEEVSTVTNETDIVIESSSIHITNPTHLDEETENDFEDENSENQSDFYYDQTEKSDYDESTNFSESVNKNNNYINDITY